MKNKFKHYIKEIITFGFFLFIATNAISLYKSSNLLKEPYPLKTLKLIDNTQFTFDTKKPLLLHFWATWCPICKAEASNIDAISKKYQVITIAVKSGDKRDIERYMKKNNLHFKVYNDKDGLLAKKFHLAAYPTTFVYNKEKELSFSDVGYSSTWGLKLRLWWSSF